MILDVGREIKMAMWFLDVPLLLKFGGSLSIVCTQTTSCGQSPGGTKDDEENAEMNHD